MPRPNASEEAQNSIRSLVGGFSVVGGERVLPNTLQELENEIIVDLIHPGNPSPDQYEVDLDLRDYLLRQLAGGQIDDEDYNRVFERGKTDYEEDPKRVSRSALENKRLRGIIAWFVIGDFSKRDRLKPEDVANFMKDFPNPWALEVAKKDVESFLDSVERQNGTKKRAIY